MPTDINGITYFTADEVREGYVPKAEHIARLKGKDEKLNEAQSLALSTQAKLADVEKQAAAAKDLEAQLTAARGELRQAHDGQALLRAGVDPGALPFLRLAHDQLISATPEAERPADADAAFREWLGAESGARAHPMMGHLFQARAAAGQAPAPSPAPAAAPAPAAPPARPVTPPPPSTVAGQPAVNPVQPSAQQVQARVAQLQGEFRGATPERRAAIQAEVAAIGAAIVAGKAPAIG